MAQASAISLDRMVSAVEKVRQRRGGLGEFGLLDQLQPALAERLGAILDDPNG